MEDKLSIVFENNDFIVANKPFGITVNRSDTTAAEKTLQDLVEEAGKIDKNDPDEEFLNRGGIVHRLDKETSGVIIIAKNSMAFRNLQAQFKERRVEKSYIALAHGKIQPEKGEINVPVGRLPWNRKRFGVISGGREALTFYEVVKYLKSGNDFLTLVRLFPKTGRTHQIRVHLKYINHPIVSDPLYGGRKVSRNDRHDLNRVFLHAEEVTFYDPKTNEKMNFKAELPSELANYLELISKDSNW